MFSGETPGVSSTQRMTGSASMLTQQHADDDLQLNLPASSIQDSALPELKVESGAPIEITGDASVPLDCCKVRSKVRSRLFNTLGFIALHVFGFLLMFFLLHICPSVKSNIVEGMHHRRLAEGGNQEDDEFSPPSTPELLDLCTELEGQLDSGKSSPEALQTSLLMFDSLFDDLAEDEAFMREAQGAHSAGSSSFSSSSNRKRFASENIESGDGAIAASMGKVVKKRALPRSPLLSDLFGTEEFFSFSGDDAFISSGSHPFEYPCFELEDRLDTSFAETARASPLMVQAFFQELERDPGFEHEAGPSHAQDFSLQETQKSFIPSPNERRPASEEYGTELHHHGPCWTAAQTDTSFPPLTSSAFYGTEEFLHGSDNDSVSGNITHPSLFSDSPGSPQSQDFLDSLLATLEHSESASVSPPNSEGASLSLAEAPVGASSDSRANDAPVHPWLKVPALKAGATVRPLSALETTLKLSVGSHGNTILRMRELLRKPVIDQNDAKGLVMYAEFLVSNALHTMRSPVKSRRPADVAEGLARRFLVFHMLHLTSKALKQPWQQQAWWTELANAIPTECPYTPGTPRMMTTSEESVTLALQLSAAIDLYKNGSAPEDDDLVFLLRKIFCSMHSPYHLRKKVWDPWREEDSKFLSST